jgi:hypothetical protein
LQRKAPVESGAQSVEQQSAELAQISPNSLSAPCGVTIGPDVRQPPMAMHVLNPKLSGSHSPLQQSLLFTHGSKVARHHSRPLQ